MPLHPSSSVRTQNPGFQTPYPPSDSGRIMTIEENKEIVRRQFELVNAGNTQGAAALWAPESWNHGRKVDNAALERVYRSVCAVHETHQLHEMVAEGDWVAVRTTCNGVFSGQPEIPVNGGIFQGTKPNGRGYSAQHLHLFRIVNGRLTEHWACRDDLGAARQLGLELRPSGD
jgi:predicted ester cyclase